MNELLELERVLHRYLDVLVAVAMTAVSFVAVFGPFAESARWHF